MVLWREMSRFCRKLQRRKLQLGALNDFHANAKLRRLGSDPLRSQLTLVADRALAADASHVNLSCTGLLRYTATFLNTTGTLCVYR